MSYMPRGSSTTDPSLVRYVFLVCNGCRKLHLLFEGRAGKALKVWTLATQEGQQAYFTPMKHEAHCTCPWS